MHRGDASEAGDHVVPFHLPGKPQRRAFALEEGVAGDRSAAAHFLLGALLPGLQRHQTKGGGIHVGPTPPPLQAFPALVGQHVHRTPLPLPRAQKLVAVGGVELQGQRRHGRGLGLNEGELRELLHRPGGAVHPGLPKLPVPAQIWGEEHRTTQLQLKAAVKLGHPHQKPQTLPAAEAGNDSILQGHLAVMAGEDFPQRELPSGGDLHLLQASRGQGPGKPQNSPLRQGRKVNLRVPPGYLHRQLRFFAVLKERGCACHPVAGQLHPAAGESREKPHQHGEVVGVCGGGQIPTLEAGRLGFGKSPSNGFRPARGAGHQPHAHPPAQLVHGFSGVCSFPHQCSCGAAAPYGFRLER
ncbi:hypothetical protein HRbin09_00223 [bacterium HR09]|nr:hypothetical protein HRbin09_00223 [bacterium HR09]